MGADTDWTVTPRPVYYADGRKEPDCYTRPPGPARRTDRAARPVPPLHLLGPDRLPRLLAVDHRRHPSPAPHPPPRSHPRLPPAPRLRPPAPRPRRPARSHAAATALDAVLAPLLDDARAAGTTVVALSEYGITPVRRPVDINRALRRAGLLEVHTQDGMEYLDPTASRAFAVADHQIAHVYVRRPEDVAATRDALAGIPGIAQLLDDEGKKEYGIDHPRAGELVALAEPRRLVHVLLLARRRPRPRLRPARRDPPQTGLRPRGTLHGPARPRTYGCAPRPRSPVRRPGCATGWRSSRSTPSRSAAATDCCPPIPADGPVLICSQPGLLPAAPAATDMKPLLLRLAHLG